MLSLRPVAHANTSERSFAHACGCAPSLHNMSHTQHPSRRPRSDEVTSLRGRKNPRVLRHVALELTWCLRSYFCCSSTSAIDISDRPGPWHARAVVVSGVIVRLGALTEEFLLCMVDQCCVFYLT